MEDADVQEHLAGCQKSAELLLDGVRREHTRIGLRFSGQPSPDGSTPTPGVGEVLLPSPTEMHDLGALISWAHNYWTQYQTLPTAEQLHLSAQSLDADQVVYITTLFCTAMAGTFLPVICSGALATASSMLDNMLKNAEQPTTSPSTSSKRTPQKLSGASITETITNPDGSSSSNDEKPAGNVTPTSKRPMKRGKRGKPLTTAARKRKKKGRK